MNEIKKKWLQLKSSERQLILIGSVLILIAVLYFYIWKPYQRVIVDYQEQIITNKNDLNWLIEANKQIKLLKNTSSDTVGSFKGSLVKTIDRSIRQNRLDQYVKSIENSGGKEVIIQFDKINFDVLIKWLGYLKKRYGILVNKADIQMEDKNSGVSARLYLIATISRT